MHHAENAHSLARNVKMRVEELNEAIALAHGGGLKLEVEVIEARIVSSRYPCPRVLIDVLEPLEPGSNEEAA